MYSTELLTEDIIKKVAIKYNISVAKVKAVIAVESAGNGIYTKGKYEGELIVRFEGHVFRKYTKGKYDRTHPYLSYTDWKLGNKYNRGINEFGRFYEAYELDKEAAWLSTSWGLFQIMGYSHSEAGYNSAKEMIIAFYKSEANQLMGFFNYCESKDILDDLRYGRYSAFARVYNGKGFAKNGYHIKLRDKEIFYNK